MHSVMQVILATAAAACGICVFAILRRFLTKPGEPGFLRGNFVAYSAAFLMSLCFALTLVTLGRALIPVIVNPIHAAGVSVLVHAALFYLVSMLIPNRPDTVATTPLPLEAAGPAS